MSLSFSVSHNSIPKKVAVLRSSSVSVLAAEAAKKHQLNGPYDVWYNGKKIDSSLPLKFTNLVNNCKLVLKPAEQAKGPIRCKIVHPQGTQLASFDHNSTLSDLVSAAKLDGNLSVNIVNETVPFVGNETVRLVELGAVDSTVIRISYVDEKKKQAKEKEEALIKQREHDRMEAKKLDLKALKDEQAAKKQQELARSSKEDEEQMDVDEEEQVQKAEQQPEAKEASRTADPTLYPREHVSTATPAQSASAPSTALPEPQAISLPTEPTKPVEIYKPSKVQMYENPDTDYEFTLDHAKKYQELIRSSATTRPPPQHKTPTEYVIRIRFPDRSILQLKVESASKFGELVSKIDENVLHPFKSNYNLKFGYPPFKALTLSFELNSKKLAELEDFQSDQIMLIWEPVDKAKGPFLNSTQHKEFNDLPEIQLEQHRNQLPDEAGASRPPASSSKKSGTPGVPKWLKINKH